MGSTSTEGDELEVELINAANKLLKPPSNTGELLDLLSKLEDLLSKVRQTPSESMLEALRPSFNAVLIDEVLRHSDSNVKISVAYCFSEIMRITAPKEPFNDDQMKEFFHLTVMSFQKLSSASGSNYSKICNILRIFSHFRLCVLILDLELNELVIQMFQHFLNVVGSNLSDPLLSDIRNIMTIVIEESEDFPYELLSLLITSVKNENQCASPSSWKLGEEVLKSCAAILKPYLPEVVKRMGIDLNDYTKTVATICQDESIEENLEANKYALVAISTGEVTPSANEPLVPPMNDSIQMSKDEAMDVKDTQMISSHCHQAAEPKWADADECIDASIGKPLELGYTDSTLRKRPKKTNPKYEEGYNSGLIIFTPDWMKHGKRTRNSSNSPASMVLALPSEKKRETKPRQRKSSSSSRIIRLPAKSHQAKEKQTTTNLNGGLNLLSDTLGDFMRAQAEERASRRSIVTLKKESDGSGDSKAKCRKQELSTKADELCSDHEGQQEPHILKVDANRQSRDGDSHRSISTEHTDSLSDAASKVKRKNHTPLDKEGVSSCVEKHGEKLVGCKIKVWWPMDEMFYDGVITSFDQSTKKHEVTYLDDEVELLNLKSERWQLVSDEEQGNAANSSAIILYDDLTYSCSPPRKRQKGQLTDSLIADVLAKKRGMHPPTPTPTLLPQADSGSQTNSSNSRGKEGDKQLALVALPFESVPPSSSQLALTSLELVDVQGYKVKPCNAPILEAIFAKHGDIAVDCSFKTTSVRASLLEVICEVVKKIQSSNVSAILSEIETLENEVMDTHAAEVKVSWLQNHLERYKRLKEAVEKCSSLKDAKVNAELVNRAAKREVEERLAALVAAEKCVKGLEFVMKKINSDILESEAEENYWRMQLEEEELL